MLLLRRTSEGFSPELVAALMCINQVCDQMNMDCKVLETGYKGTGMLIDTSKLDREDKIAQFLWRVGYRLGDDYNIEAQNGAVYIGVKYD